ncbi:hypothetical protein TSAR_007190 [Trichomalopsis sarcophagae]|uniref:Uncharacterized protein n=1 Tax=Trichomalopsis sarcophagae TaxID=543379 RepID=A0A232EHY7_9HYME|nr:hypothetical protein TSAR_007190 [Trichomalopsis sarcophagae]
MSARNSPESQALCSGWEVRKSKGRIGPYRVLYPGKGALKILNKIRNAKREGESIWEKIRDRLDSIDNVVLNASNIHKSVKSNLSAIMSQVEWLERGQVTLEKSKESFGLMLSKEEMLPNQQHIQKEAKALQCDVANVAAASRRGISFDAAKP